MVDPQLIENLRFGLVVGGVSLLLLGLAFLFHLRKYHKGP